MSPADETAGIKMVRFAVYFYSTLFGVEILAPYIMLMMGLPPQVVGDANTKAVLTNIVIAIVSYLVGKSEGSKQVDQTVAKLVESNKKAQDTIIDTVAKPNGDSISIPPGDSVTVKADPEKKE